ncbi:MAG: hypothetical protein JW940_24375 [Polyangiaceae bacterium]|nr:hypothetical protein [Polyangiaceae bacterium]
MARGIVVTFEGETSSFSLTKLDREKLYGRRERIVVDERGDPCSAAHLTTDGAAVVPPGGCAHAYVDASFDTVERSDLKAVDAEGNFAQLVPSTLGVAQPLEGPVDARRVLDHIVTAVYQLAPEAVSPKLARALEAGQVFETRFNYREDYADSPCFLLANEDATFALVACPTRFGWAAREAGVTEIEPDNAEAGESDDLDFSMI